MCEHFLVLLVLDYVFCIPSGVSLTARAAIAVTAQNTGSPDLMSGPHQPFGFVLNQAPIVHKLTASLLLFLCSSRTALLIRFSCGISLYVPVSNTL